MINPNGKAIGRWRVLAVFMAVAMLLAMFPASVFADGSGEKAKAGSSGVSIQEDDSWADSARAQLAGYEAAYAGLSDTQKSWDDAKALKALIDDLNAQIAEHEAKVAAAAGLEQAVADAQAEAAKYAVGTVLKTESGWVYGNKSNGDNNGSTQDRTNTITYKLDPNNVGGELWRQQVGFSSTTATMVYRQVERNTYVLFLGWTGWLGQSLTDTTNGYYAYLLSKINIYYEYQQNPNFTIDLPSAINTLGIPDINVSNYVINTLYGESYNNAKSAAQGAATAAENAALANQSKIEFIESGLAGALSAIAAKLDDVINRKFTAYVNSAGVAQDATVYFPKNSSASRSLPLGFRDAFPTDGGASAQFNVAWSVSSSDSSIVGVQESGGSLVLTPKGKLGSAQVTVNAAITEIGDYQTVIVVPLSFTVQVVNAIEFKSNPVLLAADSTSAGKTFENLADIPVINAQGQVNYQITQIDTEAYGRVKVEGDRIKVDKDANAGVYRFAVKVTDSIASAETVAELTVSNAYDAKYQAKLKELQDIEDEIKTLLSVVNALPAGVVDQSYIDALNAFASVTDPLEAMWHDGKPETNAAALSGFASALNAVGSVSPDLKIVTDATVGILNGLGGFIQYVPVTKQAAVEGYHIDLWLVKFDFPSLPTLYTDAITSAWGVFQGQITPITGLIRAYNGLADYVTGTDYTKLRDISSINAYIQGLYGRYAAFDDALVRFKDSDSLFVPVVDGLLRNADGLLELGLGLVSDNAGNTISKLISPLLDQYVENDQIKGVLQDLLAQGIDGLAKLIKEEGSKIDLSDLSLDKLAEYSAKLRAALFKLAKVSALIDGTINMGKDFDLAKYDLQLLDLLSGLTRIYEDYLNHLGASSGGNADVAAALKGQIDALKAKLDANASFQTAVSVYNDIVKIYNTVSKAIEYFGSDQPQKDFEAAKAALISKLEALRDVAASMDDAALGAYLDALIAEVKAAAAEALADVGGGIGESVQSALDGLAPYLDAAKGAYSSAVAAYNSAKELYLAAVQLLRDVREAYELLQGYIAEAVSGIGTYKNVLVDELKSLAGVAASSGDAELAARINTLNVQVEATAATEFANPLSPIHGALAKLIAEIQNKLGESFAEAYAKALSAYEKVVGEFAKAYQYCQDIARQIKDAVDGARAQAEAIAAAVDAIVESVPHPQIVPQGNAILESGGSIPFTTDVGWLLDVLGDSLDIAAPVYIIESAKDSLGNSVNIFSVSESGALTLNGADANDNGVYEIVVALAFDTGSAYVDRVLKNLFGECRLSVTVNLAPSGGNAGGGGDGGNNNGNNNNDNNNNNSGGDVNGNNSDKSAGDGKDSGELVNSPNQPSQAPNVTKIRTPLTKVSLAKGKSYKLPLVLDTVGGEAIIDTGLTAVSSNPSVASVVKKGAGFSVKALKAGKATITVKARNGTAVNVKITVQKKKIALKKFKASLPKKLKKGKSYQIKLSGLTKNATDIGTVTFKSSKKSIATVDAAGKVTVLKKGKVQITIKVGKKKVVKKLTI
jgi:hypothetical protein